MRSSVSSKLLRSLPSNGLCFLVLSLPTGFASAGLRYYGRSDSSPHWTSSVRMAASFRASTLCPDARARPRFGRLWLSGPPTSGQFWPSTRERSPGFTASLLPNRAIRQNLGASATVWFPLPVTAGGFHMVGSLATLSPRPYPPVQPLGLQLSSLPSGPPHLPSRERTASRLPRP